MEKSNYEPQIVQFKSLNKNWHGIRYITNKIKLIMPMNKVITLSTILSLIGVLAIGSTRSSSSLTIRFSERGNYLVSLNDKNFSAQNVFQVNGIEAGYQQLRIVKQVFNPYVENMNRTTVFNDVIHIRPGTKTTATLKSDGHFEINSISPIHENIEEHGTLPVDPEFCTNNMSIGQFNDLKKVVKGTSYSSGKLNVMLQSIKLYGCTSAQVKELMIYLPFERDRLQLTTRAYEYTSDQHLYFLVNSGFKYDYSKNKLSEYLNNTESALALLE